MKLSEARDLFPNQCDSKNLICLYKNADYNMDDDLKDFLETLIESKPNTTASIDQLISLSKLFDFKAVTKDLGEDFCLEIEKAVIDWIEHDVKKEEDDELSDIDLLLKENNRLKRENLILSRYQETISDLKIIFTEYVKAYSPDKISFITVMLDAVVTKSQPPQKIENCF